MKTTALYLKDTYLFTTEAHVIGHGQDEKGVYIHLDQTPFYPQGGGQPSDQGTLKWVEGEAQVSMVRQVGDEIRHYVTTVIPVGQAVSCHLDEARRILNARYHTAGHLVGNVVELLYPDLKASKGHSFPNEAYIEFQGGSVPALDLVQAELQASIEKALATRIFEIDLQTFEEQFYKLPYAIPNHKAFRVMQITGFLPVPCGGTHVANTRELGDVRVGKIKAKPNLVRINYGLV